MVAKIISPLPDAKTQSRNEMFLPASFYTIYAASSEVYDWTRKIGIITNLDSSFKHVSCLHIDNEINSR